jgi:hypothetical protein
MTEREALSERLFTVNNILAHSLERLWLTFYLQQNYKGKYLPDLPSNNDKSDVTYMVNLQKKEKHMT